jgi:hypothetical protein
MFKYKELETNHQISAFPRNSFASLKSHRRVVTGALDRAAPALGVDLDGAWGGTGVPAAFYGQQRPFVLERSGL